MAMKVLILIPFLLASLHGVAAAKFIIENMAVPGCNSTQLLNNQVVPRLNSGPGFEIAFIEVGMNDALGVENSVFISQYEANLKSMVRKLIAAGVTPYLVETIPVNDEYLWERHPTLTKVPNLIVDDYNQALHHAAESTSPTTHVVLMHEIFLPHVSLTVESWVRNLANSGERNGNHPTAEGAYQIALAYSLVLNLPPAAGDHRVVLFGDSITYGSGLPPEKSPSVILTQLLNPNAVHDWLHYQ